MHSRGADAPEFLGEARPRHRRGRREGRALAAPVARLKTKSRRQLPQVWPSIRPSPRDGFTAYRALSPGTGLDCSRRPRTSSDRELGLSVGRPGPHAFVVRIGAVRPHEEFARSAIASIAARASRLVTIGQNVPLASRRDAGEHAHYSEKRKRNIFEAGTGQQNQP